MKAGVKQGAGREKFRAPTFSHILRCGSISPWQPALTVATLNFSTTVYPVAAKSLYSTTRYWLHISHRILKC